MIKEKYIQTIKETSINISNSQIESIRLKNDTKTGLRVYKDSKIGVAGAIGKCNEEELERQAIDALKLNIEYPCEPSRDMNIAIDKRTDFMKDEELLQEAETFLDQLTKEQPDFIFSGKVMLQEIDTKLHNNANLELSHQDKVIALDIIYKEKASANILDGYFDYIGRRYDRKLMLEEANNYLYAYGQKVELPKEGKYPVIFSEALVPVKKMYTDLNGKLFATGGSLFSDKLGKRIFNESFSFYQSLSPDDVYNKPFFDAEGIVNENYRIPLIEAGSVLHPYTDKRTAHKYNIKATGSSSSLYDGVPAIDFLNYKIKESDKTLRELLSGEIGIMILIASGGDFTPNGDYGSPVQLAMLFDGERLIGRLPEIQISSNIYDMYGSGYRGISKDAVLPMSSTKFAVMDMNVSKL